MASATTSTDANPQTLLRQVLSFHLGAPSDIDAPDDKALPALLHPFRELGRLRTDYPLFLHSQGGRLACQPLEDQLSLWIEELVKAGAGAKGRMLGDNVARIEKRVRDVLAARKGTAAARELIQGVAKAIEDELQLRGESASTLAQGLADLVAKVPEDALLLGFDEGAALSLFHAAALAMVPAHRASFASELEALCGKLRRLIQVERSKDATSRAPNALESSLGASSFHIDTAAMSRVLGPHRGTEQADPKRRQRAEHALKTIELYLAELARQPVLTIISSTEVPPTLAKSASVRALEAADPCTAALEEFDRAAAELAIVLRAVRTARLDVEGTYDEGQHSGRIEGLSWDGFELSELRLMTPILAVDSPTRLCSEGLGALSRLLRSGKPVKVMVEIPPASEPDGTASLGDSVRFELGYFGISHREAMLHHTAAARPQHAVRGAVRSLDATRPAIHLFAAGHTIDGSEPSIGRWLHAGAAIDGRAHPLFSYDPEPGETWARRFELEGNTQTDADWPTGEFSYRDTSGKIDSLTIAFTFADFALLEPSYRQHFAIIPPGLDADELIGVEAWLRLDAYEAAQKVPFIWAVDGQDCLVRLAITRQLAFACRDRQRYWRTLQEWAGVHNEHVERAVAAAVERSNAEHEAELKRLASEHKDEVDRVRATTAAEAMQRLAQTLLSTDLGALPTAAPATAVQSAGVAQQVPSDATPQPEPVSDGAPPAQEDAGSAFDEPFIDTPLCTSCNDCLAINPLVFVYDGNKQAMIGDANAGTFEQLVRAAEKCPASCIHPGKPLNPDEPNLDDLIARAAKFN